MLYRISRSFQPFFQEATAFTERDSAGSGGRGSTCMGTADEKSVKEAVIFLWTKVWCYKEA